MLTRFNLLIPHSAGTASADTAAVMATHRIPVRLTIMSNLVRTSLLVTAAWITLAPARATAQLAATATASGATASAPRAEPSDEASLRARIEVLGAEFAVAGERLTSDGKGDTAALTSNTTAEGRAMNRRVEFAKL